MSGAMSRGEKAFLLTTGHVAGFLCGMLTPMVLSRALSVEELGTYRQVFLIIWIVGFAGSLGMDNGLFYFVRRDPRQAARISFTCVAFNVVMGALLAALLVTFRQDFAGAMNNPSLVQHAPWLALYLAVLLPGQQLPAYLVILGRIRGALLVNIANAAALALAAILGYTLGGSLDRVLQGLTLWAACRLLILFAVNRRLGGAAGPMAEWLKGLRDQLRYSLPVGLSNLLAVGLKLDRLVVASFFPVAEFTRYSVGCFDLPVLPQAVNNLHDLTSIDMVEAEKNRETARLKAIWIETVRKIQLMTMPAVAFALVFAESLIRLVFSDRYADSAGIFRWYSLVFLMTSIDAEIVFRVFGKTKQGLALDSVSLGLSFALILVGVHLYGAEGAIIGRLAAQMLTFGLRAQRAARLLDASVLELLPWKHAVATAAVSSASALLVYQLPIQSSYRVVDLLIQATLTGSVAAGMGLVSGLFSLEEKAYAMEAIRRLRTRLVSAPQ